MAAGDSPKWPGPVTFNDEDPKGTATVFLTVPGLHVKGIIKKEPKNAAVTPIFQTGSVDVTAVVDGKKFKYHKDLPVDIKPRESNVKYKEGLVILYMRKAAQDSWQEHSKFLISPPQ